MDTTIKRTSSGVKRKKRVAGCMILVLLLGGCEDLFEKDISEKRVCLIAPAHSIRTPHGRKFPGLRVIDWKWRSPVLNGLSFICWIRL